MCAGVTFGKEESLSEMGSEGAQVREQIMQGKRCLVSTQGQLAGQHLTT